MFRKGRIDYMWWHVTLFRSLFVIRFANNVPFFFHFSITHNFVLVLSREVQ